MKVMVTATQTTKMPWMKRVRANRAVARRLAARTARASSESRVVVGTWVTRWWRRWSRRQTQGFLRYRFGGRALRRRCAHGPGEG